MSKVIWIIDSDSEDALGAALEAWAHVRRKDTTATCMHVLPEGDERAIEALGKVMNASKLVDLGAAMPYKVLANPDDHAGFSILDTDNGELVPEELFRLSSLDTLRDWYDRQDPDEEDAAAFGGLIQLRPNVFAWVGQDGDGAPEHVDQRVGDVHVVCIHGHRTFRGAGLEGEPVHAVMCPGDRVTFDSDFPHEVEPGPGRCVLLCWNDGGR